MIATGTNESYCGANDGYIAITQTGGTGPYQYSIDNWATSYTTPGFNGLAAGAYTVSIMDANGCTAQDTLTISCPPAGCQASFTYTVDTNNCSVSFNNTSTGAFSYVWNFGDFSGSSTLQNPTYTYSGPGSYKVILNIYDSLGNLCDTTGQKITIYCSNPCNLVSQIASYSNPSCYGSCDGQATVTTSGGTPPYTYIWSNSATTSTNSQLCAGTYSVTVVDSSGSCSSTSVVILTDPYPIIVVAFGSDESYCGANDGSINITTAGGTPPYQYSIDCANFSSNNTFTGLSAGTYTICVTDTFGCQGTDTIIISCPPAGCKAGFTYSIDTSNCSVYFNNTSTGAFSYVWDFDDGNTSTLTSPIHLYNSNGNYWPVLFAYDSLGNLCDSAYQQITINCSNPCNLVSQIATYSNPSCYNSCDGQATVITSGGTSPYTYAWNTNPVQTNSTATGLCAGTYIVTVTDNNLCITTSAITLTAPSWLVVGAFGSDESYCGANDGSINITTARTIVRISGRRKC